ncbi:hypothetical protein D8674_025688 [Pyrus ussuriensis x Pyrus communis]|uniref:RNase H type-1 domain-containing protein n=1 Tax=Pyrus ussuriensis x Pyrus communis TaxID=2448454 RepID=A0A5N5IIU2_9ROSA|nr:hypothetical protein D8674_025688 [Pyrus ussuriensis x Pyrus communis]
MGSRWQIGTGDFAKIWDNHGIPYPSQFKVFSPKPSHYGLVFVNQFICPESHPWKVSLIRSLFTDVEFNAIVSMALSLQRPTDKLIWHYDKERHVDIDSHCVLCKGMVESTLHLMRDCYYASCAWLSTCIGKPPTGNTGNSMKDWAPFLASHLGLSWFGLCLMVWWALWGAQNEMLWNDRCEGPDLVVARALSWWQLAKLRGLQNFILKSDSLQITSALNSIFLDMYFIGHIVEDSKAMLTEIIGASIAHACWQRNEAAHRLARSALSSSCDRAWFEEPPDIILDVLLSEGSN